MTHSLRIITTPYCAFTQGAGTLRLRLVFYYVRTAACVLWRYFMHIFKVLMGQIRQYKRSTLLTPVFTLLEVVMEILIPYITASLIDQGIEGGSMDKVLHFGLIMLLMAFASLFFGIMSGTFASDASTGFAANLRQSMYENIQTFSFSNIDKYSTPGLVTRMTTHCSTGAVHDDHFSHHVCKNQSAGICCLSGGSSRPRRGACVDHRARDQGFPEGIPQIR